MQAEHRPVDRPPAPTRAYVGLGANLGDPLTALRQAVDALAALPGTVGLRLSPLYRTAPVEASGPDFLNAVAELHTTVQAPELLAQLQAIEERHGRRRPWRNAPRTLDLDVLLWGEERIQRPDLQVPHPRMHLRAFVLAPLLDLDPQAVVPGHGPARALLAALQGQRLERLIQRIDPPAAVPGV